MRAPKARERRGRGLPTGDAVPGGWGEGYVTGCCLTAPCRKGQQLETALLLLLTRGRGRVPIFRRAAAIQSIFHEGSSGSAATVRLVRTRAAAPVSDQHRPFVPIPSTAAFFVRAAGGACPSALTPCAPARTLRPTAQMAATRRPGSKVSPNGNDAG